MAGGLQTHSADFRVVPWRPAVVLATVRVSESEKWAQLCHLGQIILPLRTFRLVNLESILQFQHFY